MVQNISHRHHGPLDSTTLRSANLSPTVCHLPRTDKSQIHLWGEHLSKVPDAVECEHLPNKVGNDDELQSGLDPDEDDKHADELPWDVFWRFLAKIVCGQNCFSSCLDGWSQMVLEVKMVDAEAVDWCGHMWSTVGCTAKFSETPSESAYGRQEAIQFTVHSPGRQSCSHASWMRTCIICGWAVW